MASFAKPNFAYASYAAFRPSYPPSLFRTVLAYHRPGASFSSPSPSGTLLDLGCGHGLIARALAPHFTSVTALDPSAGMVAQARRLTPREIYPSVTIRQGSAEDLSFLPAASVDLAVAGQAAHWFDYGRAWPELARVVRAGGSLAFWGYKDNVLVGYPAAAAVYERFVYGRGEIAPGGMEAMGRFWQQPGRGILRDSLRAVEPPAGQWEDVRRVVWDPDRERADAGVPEAPEEALWQRKRLRLGEYEGYLRTFSSFNNWKAEHGEKHKSRAEGGEGDVVDAMFDALLEAVPEWKAKGEQWRDVEVESVWGTVILMARRRS
ncbi:Methyltransferase-like protein [Pleurostoma richardsiae]|uniref:Methyltransferase-like protein n=1 Tax=Pleurostoma richardsiae TaxID=41990 RepID=A0AA38RYH1_9PEZI|nr:Methyltransferase-like protein [Pleurostoma richardsiae]